MWKNGRLDYSELSNTLPRAVKGELLAEEIEKCKILGILLDKEMENLGDHCCRKVEDLADEGFWICLSYPFRHKTTRHCAD